ncbi:hypothetical protein VBZ67_00595 [Campylobacter concisus]
MKLDTLIVKGIEAKNNPNKAVVPPVFLASTFVQDDLENFKNLPTHAATTLQKRHLMISLLKLKVANTHLALAQAWQQQQPLLAL